LEVRRQCQKAWEEREGVKDPEHVEFIRRFGESYL
jgi:pyrroloquinoline quinone (PQQ) biosynthesis protein C